MKRKATIKTKTKIKIKIKPRVKLKSKSIQGKYLYTVKLVNVRGYVHVTPAQLKRNKGRIYFSSFKVKSDRQIIRERIDAKPVFKIRKVQKATRSRLRYWIKIEKLVPGESPEVRTWSNPRAFEGAYTLEHMARVLGLYSAVRECRAILTHEKAFKIVHDGARYVQYNKFTGYKHADRTFRPVRDGF